jgi:hypothetical protein
VRRTSSYGDRGKRPDAAGRNVLIWLSNGVTYRLEGQLTKVNARAGTEITL